MGAGNKRGWSSSVQLLVFMVPLRAKNLCLHLEVIILEKGQLLSKPLAGQCQRGHKALCSSYFLSHGPADTVAWFTQLGVALKEAKRIDDFRPASWLDGARKRQVEK